MDDKLVTLFFGLLRSSLWQTTITGGNLDGKSLQSLLTLSRQQTVSPLVAQALIIPENQYKIGLSDVPVVYHEAHRFKQFNRYMNKGVAALASLLSQHDIPYVIVKGQTLAVHYPQWDLRVPGDIDFYIPPTHFEQAQKVIQQTWQVAFEEEDEDEHQHLCFVRHQIPFEMHYNLFKFFDAENQSVFDQYLSENLEHPSIFTLEGQQIATLTPEMCVLYTFLHLFHHLVEIGVGARQFCDVAILLHTHRHQIDVEKLQSMLRALNVERAFCAIEAVLETYFGLPKADLLIPTCPSDYQYTSKIISQMLHGGNFGKYGRKEAVRSSFLYYVHSLETKVKLYRLYYHLAPREIKAMTIRNLPERIFSGFRRTFRRRK